MPLVLNRADNNRYVDLTDTLVEIPNNVGITNALGLFTPVYSSQKTVEIRRSTRQNHILLDRNWDERNQTIAGRSRDTLTLKVPHFPADDAITPNDIDGQVQANSIQEAMGLESVASVRAEKMIDLREAHGLTLEAARMQLITTGTAYAPNGTLRTSYGPTVNYYTEFGITREEIGLDFSGVNDPRPQMDEVIAAIRGGIRNGQAGTLRGFVVLCSKSFYNALYTNPFITDVVKYNQNNAQAMAILMGTGGTDVANLDARFRQITVGGITWIDAGDAGYDDPATGDFVPFIPEGDAFAVPVGVRDMFKTYYSPANRFATVNRAAQGSYWFEYANEKDDIIEIMTEQNFLNAVLYPQAIVRLYLDV